MQIQRNSTYKTDLATLLVYSLVLHPIVINKFSMICYLLLYGCALMYIVFSISPIMNMITDLKASSFVTILFSVLLFVVAAIYPYAMSTGDYSYVGVTLAVFRKILLLAFLATYTIRKFGRENCLQMFIYYYCLSNCVYVLGTVLFLIVPPLKSLWQDLLGRTEYLNHLYSTYGYSTRFGWSGFTGYRGTFDCSVSIVFALFLYSDTSLSERLSTFRFMLISLILFAGNVFYGRSGIIVSLICICLGLLIYRKISVRFFMYGFMLLALIVFSFSILKRYISTVNVMYNWAIQPVVDLMTTGQSDNYSVNHLFNDMIYMPSPSTFIFGDAMYTANDGLGAYYGHTDSGFMRQILFWGVGGCLLSYLTTCLSIFSMGFRFIKFELLSIILFAIFEIKGEVYYEIIPIYLMLGLLLVYAETKQTLRKGEKLCLT